jgi:hypothetical protein
LLLSEVFMTLLHSMLLPLYAALEASSAVTGRRGKPQPGRSRTGVTQPQLQGLSLVGHAIGWAIKRGGLAGGRGSD